MPRGSERAVKVKRLPPLDPNQRYDIAEACAYLRQSRQKTFSDIKAGKLIPIRDGGRTFIPGTEIARLSTRPS
jgi:hypothetical protein